MTISTLYPTLRPKLNLDFTTGVFDPRITFTRASVATRFNSLGVLETVTNNIPRFDYDPSSLAIRGFLVEEERTNSIRNNTMQGAVAGTPGTIPTNWALGIGTLSSQVVGTGTEDGISYIDIRIFGTNSSGSSLFPGIYFETTTGIAASTGQVWAESLYLKLAAGTGIAFDVNVHELDSGGAFLRSVTLSGTTGTPTTDALKTQRRSGSVTLGASTAFVRPLIAATVLNGASVDFTLRIGMPQLELGSFATSVIPTTTATVTRLKDDAIMTGTNFSSWYNATQGTFFSESSSYTLTNSSAVINRTDAGQADLLFGGFSIARSRDNVPTTINSNAFTNVLANQPVKMAMSYQTGVGRSVTGQGLSPVDGTYDGSYSTVVGIRFGPNGAATTYINGHIRHITYYSSRLSNSQLQALTAS